MLLAAVLFILTSPQAKSVQFEGDSTNWKPVALKKKDADWTYKAALPPDARVEYKFIVDGTPTLDPHAPKTNDRPTGETSVWQGPKYKLDVPDADPKLPLRRSEATIEGFEVVIFKPLKSKGLPIIAYVGDQAYETQAKVQNVVENFVEQGKIRPIVLILINPNEQQDSTNTSKAEASFANQVLPWVRQETQASSRPEDVYLSGAGQEAVFALRLAEDYPDKVGGGIQCQSADFKDPEDIVPEVLGRLTNGIRIFLDYGHYEEQTAKSNSKAASALKQANIEFKTLITPEGQNWTAYRHRLPAGLEYLLASRKEPAAR